MDNQLIEKNLMDPSNFNKRRFKYKLHLIITDDDGNIIKDCKYTTAGQCSKDNIELFKSGQIVTRLSNKFEFTKGFTKYNNVCIDKINEI